MNTNIHTQHHLCPLSFSAQARPASVTSEAFRDRQTGNNDRPSGFLSFLLLLLTQDGTYYLDLPFNSDSHPPTPPSAALGEFGMLHFLTSCFLTPSPPSPYISPTLPLSSTITPYHTLRPNPAMNLECLPPTPTSKASPLPTRPLNRNGHSQPIV